jgi:imidazolonepropionase-like amidohydrolase
VHLLFEGQCVKGVSKERQGDFLGKYAVVTPAFIDAHCHIGMERAGEPGSEGEANDQMDALLFLADALDSIQMDDAAFRDSIEMGVLYSCVLPGSGNIVGGRSAIIRNYARTTTEALIKRSGLKAALGHNPKSTREWKGTRPWTRMGALSLLRRRLIDVQRKMETGQSAGVPRREESAGIPRREESAGIPRRPGKRKAGERPSPEAKAESFTAEEEIIREILEGKLGLRVHVHKIDDIASLLRLRDEFNIRVTVDHACDVHDGHIYSMLKERGIPVVYGPLDAFAYKVELKHENWRNVKHLIEAGVDFGLMTDHPVIPQRNLLLELRWFVRCCLNRQDAIEIITRRNAQILGLETILGTLEKGKWASFSCWNGDPFDMTRYPVKVFGEGNAVFEDG